MHHFDYRDGALYAEDVPLARIAAEVGTPTYVYSQATLERHYRVFLEAFAPRRPLIAYAVKANGNVAVLAALARLGAGADVVSMGEIQRALAAGVPPGRIVFSGVGKTEQELEYAVSIGVHQINVESPAELDMLAAVAERLQRRAALALRVNPDIGAGANDKITTGHGGSKFGVSLADAERLYAQAAGSAWLQPVGLAAHIGSQIEDLGPLEQAFALLRSAAERLRAAGLPLTRLDLGGGLGVPYTKNAAPPAPSVYAALVNRAFEGFEAELIFEPGRLIAGNAGVLLTRVIRAQTRPDRRILVLDAAMNDLLRPSLYGAHHALTPVRETAAEEIADLVGPVCETGDTFARAASVPALQPGDLACFMTAGAYAASMSSTYNARPLVAEVLVSGDRYALVRRRLTTAELLRLETVPDWLHSPGDYGR